MPEGLEGWALGHISLCLGRNGALHQQPHSLSALKGMFQNRMTANAATRKQHPPAVQPRRCPQSNVAEGTQSRHPLPLAKLDVSRAFKWHDLENPSGQKHV